MPFVVVLNDTSEGAMSRQQHFNPANFHFAWTSDGWYEWDRKAAHSAALKARNAKAKALAAAGHRVVKSSIPNQLITRGGIGSGNPEISMFVTVYMLEVM
jgi:hypothetical protein